MIMTCVGHTARTRERRRTRQGAAAASLAPDPARDGARGRTTRCAALQRHPHARHGVRTLATSPPPPPCRHLPAVRAGAAIRAVPPTPAHSLGSLGQGARAVVPASPRCMQGRAREERAARVRGAGGSARAGPPDRAVPTRASCKHCKGRACRRGTSVRRVGRAWCSRHVAHRKPKQGQRGWQLRADVLYVSYLSARLSARSGAAGSAQICMGGNRSGSKELRRGTARERSRAEPRPESADSTTVDAHPTNSILLNSILILY
ncbi:hypothetical protein BV25DRAFT_326829 [Artomyces pyxidatus]|uniref:Uncharacterized protein n=1 Tax=Artomyces pyxidatus TaxID=48021 RepID=A0ACB8T6D8_9AGAM|nr:hypothetical protein BV25DRAFT_326829 [Artomyces pyxidatus]